MSNIPPNMKYSEDDEWVLVEGETATIGITDYAQDALSDIVYLELSPSAGDVIEKDDIFGTVESVKAASDLVMPVTAEIIEVNDDLADTPETINEDPYNAGWMLKVKLKDPKELDDLMDAEAYAKYNEERE